MKKFRPFRLLAAMLLPVLATPAFAQFTTGGNGQKSIGDDDYQVSSGYHGFVDLGYSVGVGEGEGRIELSTTHGYQFCPYFFAGVGAGVNYFHEAEAWGIPIFADFRGELPLEGKKFAPFVDFRMGYSVVDIEGFYLSPSIGLRIALSKSAGFNVSIGYSMQKADYLIVSYYGGYNYYYDSAKLNCGGFTIKVGLDF